MDSHCIFPSSPSSPPPTNPKTPSTTPPSKLTSFLTFASNAIFLVDVFVLCTDEDFQNSSSASFPSSTTSDVPIVGDTAPFIQISDIETTTTASSIIAPTKCDHGADVDYSDHDLFNVVMRAAIEHFTDIHFYHFDRPATVPEASDTCDMAWRFHPRIANNPTFYKDYRRYHLIRSANCTLIMAKIGDYHSGVNARKCCRSKCGSRSIPTSEAVFKPKKNLLEVEEPKTELVPVVREAINDNLPVTESESTFSVGKYLVYVSGGDCCKSMNHYLWSFLYSLGEAQYLVMDLIICHSSIYIDMGDDVDSNDFRFYFNFEHLRDSASVIIPNPNL